MTAPAEDFESWAILEIMGHRQVAGFVRDVVLFGNRMARVEVPEVPATTRKTWEWKDGHDVQVEVPVPAIPGFTAYYGGSAIFSCVPTTEELARMAAAQFRTPPPRPLAPTSRQLAAPPPDADLVEGDDEPRDGFEAEELEMGPGAESGAAEDQP